MGPNETCLSIRGSFSWGFTSNQTKTKDDKKDSTPSKSKSSTPSKVDDMDFSSESKVDPTTEKKKLEKFINLKDIKMEVKKGEFICIIGDVGSGKSSLLQCIIGDLIYLPQSEIDEFGGLDGEGTQEEFDTLKGRLCGDNLQLDDKPIKIKGSVAYVEQVAWI